MAEKPAPFAVLRPFVRGLGVFAQRLPALISCVILLGIAWGNWGSQYNVPNLLWQHFDSVWSWGTLYQCLNGVSVVLLFGYVWLVTFVVEVRVRGSNHIASIAPEPPRWLARVIDFLLPRAQRSDDLAEGMRFYFVLTWLPLLVAIALAACFRLSIEKPLALCERWPFLLGVAVTFFSGVLFSRLSRDWWPADRVYSTRNLAGVFFFACLCGFGAWCFFNNTTLAWRPLWLRGNYFPPIISLCVLFGVINGIAGVVWYIFGNRAPWAFLVLTAWFLVCNCFPYKQRFAALHYEHLLCISDAEEPEAPPPGAQELTAPTVKPAEESEQQPILAAGCARLHARLFPSGQQEDFEKQTYEQLFKRYRKLQLIEVYVNLCQQLKQAESAQDHAGLDRMSYADLFSRYAKLRDDVCGIEETQFLDSWRKNLAKTEQGKPRLAVLAVTGGANRSAYWVNVALARIERELKGPDAAKGGSRFPSHLRLITGASGGMVGASQYVATLDPQGRHVAWNDDENGVWTIAPGTDGNAVLVDLPRKYDPVAQVDYLTPVVNRLVFCDLPLAAWPIRSYTGDRGECLEDCFNGNTHEMEQPFDRLRPGEAAGWRPSMVFSPMLVEDGRRLLISNLPLGYLADSSGALLLGDASQASGKPNVRRSQYAKGANTPVWKDVYARSAVELFRLFPDAAARFKLCTAARMSATFPYISPAVELPTDPPRRVVDAGYFDNYGIDVAAGWIGSHSTWLKANTSGVILIQLRDAQSSTSRRQLVDPREATESLLARRWHSSFHWMVSPVDAATTAYFAVPSFRNDEHLQSLDRMFNGDPPKPSVRPFFATVVFERPGEMAMNWDLEQGQIEGTEKGMDVTENHEALEALKKWWDRGYEDQPR
jgi:hypothetical protein